MLGGEYEMQTRDMTFFEEFKRLENILNDLFSCKSGVTEYLNRMEQAAARGRSAVPGWDADYRQLKRLRWLRNRIAHDANVNGLCSPSELTQLRQFHKRVISRDDPLAMLNKAASSKSAAKGKKSSTPEKPGAAAARESGRKANQRPKQSHTAAVILLIFVVLLLIAGIAILYLDVSGLLPLPELLQKFSRLAGN